MDKDQVRTESPSARNRRKKQRNEKEATLFYFGYKRLDLDLSFASQRSREQLVPEHTGRWPAKADRFRLYQSSSGGMNTMTSQIRAAASSSSGNRGRPGERSGRAGRVGTGGGGVNRDGRWWWRPRQAGRRRWRPRWGRPAAATETGRSGAANGRQTGTEATTDGGREEDQWRGSRSTAIGKKTKRSKLVETVHELGTLTWAVIPCHEYATCIIRGPKATIYT
jgi:hypothetical protein